jgi:hypothetical protein
MKTHHSLLLFSFFSLFSLLSNSSTLSSFIFFSTKKRTGSVPIVDRMMFTKKIGLILLLFARFIIEGAMVFPQFPIN